MYFNQPESKNAVVAVVVVDVAEVETVVVEYAAAAAVGVADVVADAFDDVVSDAVAVAVVVVDAVDNEWFVEH